MYEYENVKTQLFTDDGQRMFLRARDLTHGLIKDSGAVRLNNIIRGLSGDTYLLLACVDRLVELNEIIECIHECGKDAQSRIFIAGSYQA